MQHRALIYYAALRLSGTVELIAHGPFNSQGGNRMGREVYEEDGHIRQGRRTS